MLPAVGVACELGAHGEPVVTLSDPLVPFAPPENFLVLFCEPSARFVPAGASPVPLATLRWSRLTSARLLSFSN